MMFSVGKEFSLLIAVSVSCLFVWECKGQAYKPAPSCARLNCPPYTVVYTKKDYEIRSYKEALWVSSPNIVANSYKDGSKKGFLILFAYYKGGNKQHVRINMTAPVLVDIQNSTYTVHFYVPHKYQNDTLPAPLVNVIKQVKLPQHDYAAVRRFGGFLNKTHIPTEVAALKKSLQGSPYQRAASIDNVTVAGYSSPFELANRVNEIFLWFD